MTRRFIGVRWWLGAAFALVAAVSTAIVVAQFSSRSEQAFRVHAEQLAVQSATFAANDAAAADRAGTLSRRLGTIAQHFDLDLYVYAEGGQLIAKAPARTQFAVAPGELASAFRAASTDRSRAFMTRDGGIVVVGEPLRTSPRASIVAVSRRPDVAAAIGILNDQALRAGVIAGLIGVLVGLIFAQLIALRLRRLTSSAEAIAAGDFERSVSYRFRDEFGALAQSFDRMRRQLRRSFRHIEG
jgi:methyl-accepting chemotaxis protein